MRQSGWHSENVDNTGADVVLTYRKAELTRSSALPLKWQVDEDWQAGRSPAAGRRVFWRAEISVRAVQSIGDARVIALPR